MKGNSMKKRKYSNNNNFLAKNNLDVGDVIIDLDGRVKGYGQGVIKEIHSFDLFSVKFEDRELPVMFTADGCRYDRSTSAAGVKKERAMKKGGVIPNWYASTLDDEKLYTMIKNKIGTSFINENVYSRLKAEDTKETK